MKKFLLSLILIALTGLIIACGSDDNEENSNNSGDTEKTESGEEVESDNDSSDDASDGIYFDGDVAQISDLKVEIVDTKVIPPGEEGNEYSDKPVLAIWYETTNFTDKEIDPITAWLVIFTAIQDNNPDSINKLEVGSLPDQKHLDSQMEIIKKDGTVENSISYELDDLETPVTLVATRGIAGEEIGRAEYEVK